VQDVSVGQEDQARINMFARKNIFMCELKEQVEEKQVIHKFCEFYLSASFIQSFSQLNNY